MMEDGAGTEGLSRDLLIDEAIEVATSLEKSGGRLPGSLRARGSGDLVSTLRDLKEEKAGFGPRPEVLSLNEETLAAEGVTLDHRVKALLERCDFYLVTFPVTLFPKRSWAFNRLECQIELNPGEPSERRPVAHDIYPASAWETLAKWNLNLAVGVTEALEFRTPKVDVVVAGADVSAQLSSGAKFVFPPRDYCVKRARILSRGKDNCEVFWRLDDAEFFAEDEPRLGIILKAPRGLTPLQAAGVLNAYRSFQALSATLGDLMDYLSERVRTFLQKGAPLVDRGEWELKELP